jgi:hypothetical protein
MLRVNEALSTPVPNDQVLEEVTQGGPTIPRPLQEVAGDLETRPLSRVRREQASHSVVLEPRVLETVAELPRQDACFDAPDHDAGFEIFGLGIVDVVQGVRVACRSIGRSAREAFVLVVASFEEPLNVQADDWGADEADVDGLLFGLEELLAEVFGVVAEDVAREDPFDGWRAGEAEGDTVVLLKANGVSDFLLRVCGTRRTIARTTELRQLGGHRRSRRHRLRRACVSLLRRSGSLCDGSRLKVGLCNVAQLTVSSCCVDKKARPEVAGVLN